MDTQPAEVVEKVALAPETTEKAIVFPEGMDMEQIVRIQKQLKDPNRQRGLVFENEKQRNAMAIRKGLTKPGRVDYETLRRISTSVYIARICINSLKEKITRTKWVVQPIDATKRKNARDTDKRIKEVEDFFKHPNENSETFRTMLDKMTEDLLVLDAVSLEKTRFPNGKLAEMYFVDSTSIRPVFDERGNQDIEIKLPTVNGDELLPVSYLQVLNNSAYGGPESGDIVAAWPKKDFVYFHMHPQGSMEGFGYGLSPLEGVLSVVSNLLNSDNFNSTYFEEGAFPPIILNIIGNMAQRDMDAYREYFYQELDGNFHRPMLLASAQESKVIDLKHFSQRDMQFMEYTLWLAKMLCAAYGMSPDDIGITDTTGSKSVSETQKDISQAKGYASILELYKSIFNQEIIWKDFGYDDLEFDWAGTDTIAPLDNSQIQDRALRNGAMTLNEVRMQNGETAYPDWADKPMFLGANGYVPLVADEPSDEEVQDTDDGGDVEPAEENQPDEVGGEKPYNEQDTGDIKGTKVKKNRGGKPLNKAIFTQSGFKVWADDRGTAQPFIFMDIKTGMGSVIKPPVAVNLQSQELEISLTSQLASMGLNVNPVTKMTYKEVLEFLGGNMDVSIEFHSYVMMMAAYDSEKWKAKFGGSRKFPYYLVSTYIDGFALSNPLLIADMKRDPESYRQSVIDLANLWKAERDLILGDRRADQYIIAPNKRGYGFDYQFAGDVSRWEKTQSALPDALAQIPELKAIFDAEVQSTAFTATGVMKAILNKIKRKSV